MALANGAGGAIRDPPSIRTRMLRLVAASVLPALLGAPFLVEFVYRRERAQLEQSLLQTARALAQALDRELSTARAGVEAVAGSRSFAEDDVAGMYRHAVEFAKSGLQSNFVLSDETGQQLFNTLRPYGVPLPHHGNMAQLRRVFESGKPIVSDIYVGGLLRRPLMSIDAPVLRNGKVVYDLSAGLLPERLGDLLRRQDLPPGYLAVIVDTQGTIGARTHLEERFVGQKAADAMLKALQRADEGTLVSPTVEGIPSYIAFSRARVSRWAVGLAAPTSLLLRDVRQYLAVLTLGALALLAIGVGLTLVQAGRIARSVRTLVKPAMALGSGQPVAVPRLAVREADEVARTLVTAAELLRQRTEERDRARDAERETQILAAERQIHGERLQAALDANEKLVAELREALQGVRTLSGLLPICAWCHKIRDDEGYWRQLEAYISQHTEAQFSHGLCPECYAKQGGEDEGAVGNG